MLLSFIVGPLILQAAATTRPIHQVVREGTPDSHAAKSKTPTMGGLIILVRGVGPDAALGAPRQPLCDGRADRDGVDGRHRLPRSTTCSSSSRSARGLKNEGLVERYKLDRAGHRSASRSASTSGCSPCRRTFPGASTTLPFYKYMLIVPHASPARCTCCSSTFILTGMSNAVNLTDGLDGLAAGLSGDRVRARWRSSRTSSAASTSQRVPRHLLPPERRRAHGLLHGDVRGADRLPLVQHASRRRSSWATPARSRSAARSAPSPSCSSPSSCCSSSAGCFVAETISVILQRSVFKYRKRRYGLEYAQRASRLSPGAAPSPFRGEGMEREPGRGALLDHRHPRRLPRPQHAQASLTCRSAR